MFYEQLLHEKILKAQKDTDDLTGIFMFLGSTCVKAVCKTLMKLTPGGGGATRITGAGGATRTAGAPKATCCCW